MIVRQVDEALRRRYLEAMGIPLWLSRDAPSVAPETGIQDASPPVVASPPEVGDATRQVGEAAVPEGVPPARPASVPIIPEPRAAIAGLDWDALEGQVTACRACEDLVANRTRTVFGVGNRAADLMVIGEAPGADEDRQGEPFVGRAGQLLNAMLLAVGLRREQVFIANVLKCRPPGNRDPGAEEALRCEPYLLRQIELVGPKVILSVGRISAQNLLKTDITVGRLRGQVHRYGERGIPLVVTYHPAYLLRSPEQKARAWEDLQLALKTLRAP